MKKLSLCSFLLLLLCGFIMRRHDVADEKYLELAKTFEYHVANLNLPDGNATFISKDWLVTAAHAAIVIKEKLKNGEEHFISFQGNQFKVEEVVLPRKWRRNKRHDIALIHLSGKVEEAQPVELYRKEDETDKLIYIVGNGGTGNGKEGYKGKTDWRYRAATNRIDEVDDFYVKFDFDSPETSGGEATEMEGVSGPGDSGGPAFVKENGEWLLAGVSSSQKINNGATTEGEYGVVEQYMRISQYSDWINKHVQ